jgi:DNA anti-recombination protein RmuC
MAHLIKNIEPFNYNYRYRDNLNYLPTSRKLTATAGSIPIRRNPIQFDRANKDFINRELGFTKQVIDNNKKLFSLDRPVNYMKHINTNLNNLMNDVNIIYQQELLKNYNQGYDLEEAKTRAMKFASKIANDLYEENKNEFSKYNKVYKDFKY